MLHSILIFLFEVFANFHTTKEARYKKNDTFLLATKSDFWIM